MIVDANVALKWVLQQPDSDAAARLALRDDLAAPVFMLIEAGHVLTRETRQRRLSAQQASAAFELISAAVRPIDDALISREAFDLSLDLGASLYDCLYLAAALRENDVLVTADTRFVRTVHARSGYARHISALA